MAETVVKVLLPELGESVTEGSVTGWRKRVGDRVVEGEALVDVTTDKVDVEIPTPASGTLARILVPEGNSVAVGAALAEIDTSASPAIAQATAEAPDVARVAPASAPVAGAPARPQSAASLALASPMVKRLAERRGVDLQRLTGTGVGGRITAGDVIAAANGEIQTAGEIDTVDIERSSTVDVERSSLSRPTGPKAAVDVKSTAPMAESSPLKGPHAALVRAMEESLTIPTATSFRTISVDALDGRRRQLNDALKAAGRADKISFTHLIAFALVRATAAVPAITNGFARTPDGPQRLRRGAHLGLAVDTQTKDRARFLVVPVIHDAAALDFAAFHAAYEALVARARGAALTVDDVAGATFTLTNPGGIGTIASVPRLMAGQGAIIATGAIAFPPGFSTLEESSLRKLGVSKVMTLTSTYDHRVVQGAESGEFLRRVDQLLNGADGFFEEVFSTLGLGPPPAFVPAEEPRQPRPADGDVMRAAAAAMALVVRYRVFGHTAANLDPLSGPAAGDPALDPRSLGLSKDFLAKIPAAGLRVFVPGKTVAEVLENLRATYTSTIAYEIEHISNHEQRNWLREQIETGAHRAKLSKSEKLALLDRLSSVEAFERFLRRAYLGHKTFTIEGLDAMVPMLDEMIALLAQDGATEVDIGIAHRGRLAVITHVVGWPFEDILREFEQVDVDPQINADVTGDVKYHQGARGTRPVSKGKTVEVILEANPSHLEAVDSVVEGRTRAAQTDRTTSIATQDTRRAVPVLVHGDAAFPAQGVVAEVFNMQSLPGYATGGTLHLIANNQIGFTTPPEDGRSTRYASDLAKGFDVPIVHVNADDVEACVSAVKLAVAFRRKFSRDALIDLVGYRRFGHNETDEPAYTLPLMYERIKKHKPVREIYARQLVSEGVTSDDDVAKRLEQVDKRIAGAHARVKAEVRGKDGAKSASVVEPASVASKGQPVATAVSAKVLKSLNDQLLTVPRGFTIHPKLVRQIERRRTALESGNEIDWGTAEALAFGSLLQDGIPIRLTGQDTERGTFSQRHLGFYDARSGQRFIPAQHLKGAKAAFEVFNSPLSEYAPLGFEYGYSAAAPNALVLWEAQFGDFINGAQVIVDQFFTAGLAKWGQTSRLVLLLPHGYEGAGPEHSSARLERFLQLAAEGNFRIANCSTPAQYFHLLRDQAQGKPARPLVIMTPKGLLRLKAASSRLDDFANGGFAKLIDDPAVTDRQAIRRIILCSGRVYYDLIMDRARREAKDLAIVRVELLEPFPLDDVLAMTASYANVQRVIWVQEEPKNQGARAFVSRRIRERLLPKGISYEYVGRPDRASTSEGFPGAHAVEQQRIVAEALGTPPQPR